MGTSPIWIKRKIIEWHYPKTKIEDRLTAWMPCLIGVRFTIISRSRTARARRTSEPLGKREGNMSARNRPDAFPDPVLLT